MMFRCSVRLPSQTSRGERYFALQTLKAALPQVIVQGIPSVSRAVISHDETARGPDPCYKLLVEGYSLLDVMGTPGVVGTETLSNHIIEVEHTLGIEAARVMVCGLASSSRLPRKWRGGEGGSAATRCCSHHLLTYICAVAYACPPRL